MDGSHGAESHEGGAAGHGESHIPIYRRTILTLSGLTAVEFAIAYTMQHGLSFVLGVLLLVGLACWKAILVARFFMHIKYDPRILALIIVTPVVLAAPLVVLVGFDLLNGPNLN
jgi:caa(3)-type oxidase subunit IV